MGAHPSYCHVDYETFYDKKSGYSVASMHPWAYINDPRFNAYMVSLVSSEGWEYVGPVESAPWGRVAGADLLGAHNAAFEGPITERLQQDGVIPKFPIQEWIDTADLAVFLRHPRYLGGACEQLFGVALNKEIRDRMDGLRLVDARAQGFEKELLQYCLEDSRYAARIWTEHGHKWPQAERRISQLNREAAQRGMRIDWPRVEEDKERLMILLHDMERRMPWIDQGDKPLSVVAFREEAAKHGLIVPASLDQRNPHAVAWFEAHAADHPWIQATRDWRRVNTLLAKVSNLLQGRRPDGRFTFESRYMGAVNTGRFAGGPGRGGDSDNRFNVYNLPKKPMFDTDLRGYIIPDEGHALFVYDFSQIEARILLWRAGDVEMLEACRRYDLYEAYARKRLGYTDPRPLKDVDKELRNQSKTIVLGCGYQCGPSKHRSTCQALYGRVISEEQAKEEVFGYRGDNPKVVGLWAEHQLWLGVAADKQVEEYTIPLPSGRHLSYFDLEVEADIDFKGRPRRGYVASTTRGTKKEKLYGGKLTENEIQAIARDVLCASWIRCHDAGYPLIWTVYDESIGQVPLESVEQARCEIPAIMSETPDWLPGCPLGVEGAFLPRYCKI